MLQDNKFQMNSSPALAGYSYLGTSIGFSLAVSMFTAGNILLCKTQWEWYLLQ